MRRLRIARVPANLRETLEKLRYFPVPINGIPGTAVAPRVSENAKINPLPGLADLSPHTQCYLSYLGKNSCEITRPIRWSVNDLK